MENLMTKYKHLKNIDPTAIVNTPDADSYFSTTTISKISRLKEIERSKIILEIQPHVVPTCICGNDCSVNVKGFRLLERKFGIKSPFSSCASHTSTGAIHRLCTTETISQADAKALYENLRSLLKHFAKFQKGEKFSPHHSTYLKCMMFPHLIGIQQGWLYSWMHAFKAWILLFHSWTLSLVETLPQKR